MAQGQVYVGSNVEQAPVVYQGPVTLNSGLRAGGVLPTVALGAGAGTGTVATISAQLGTDMAGSFTINTGTGATAAGTIATVTFGTQLVNAPAAVVVNMVDVATPAVIAAGAGTLANTGFAVISAAPTASKHYAVTYQVIQSAQG